MGSPIEGQVYMTDTPANYGSEIQNWDLIRLFRFSSKWM